MTIEEAIYCMESYLFENELSCVNCPYYGSRQIDNQTCVCCSSEAHKLAIKALEKMLKEQ